MWTIEEGVLKSHGLLEQWGADLATKKTYKDFVLLVDFRMPTKSDSGIHFRKLIPEMGNFGQTEQMNLGMGLRMGQLESIGFMRANKLAAAQRLKDKDIPKVRRLDPIVGQWHTLKIIMIGRTLSAELDGQAMIDRYEYPEWLLSTEPEQLRFQKHRFLENQRTGKKNPCPIEFRNIFIKEVPVPIERKPNVVVLLADDLGWKDLSCYGGPVKTPTLDSLAARGVRFTDFHAGAAICSPSRATLLTGRQHLRTGIYGVLQDHLHNAHLLKREVTIAEVLQQAGYETAHFGKWHVGMTSGKRRKPTLKEHGFDYWFGLSNGASPSHKNPVNFQRNGEPVGPLKGYSCQLVVDDAIRWLNERNQPDQPFFLNIWFNEPHAKLAAPDEIVSVYGDLRDEASIYSATIDNTDRAIGRLVAKLKETGRLDNTLIVYSSDNGSYRADRNGGLHGNKGSNFEGGLRSPGIFFWPDGFRGGRTESAPAGSVDLLPTICGLIGIDKPAEVHLDGADLSPLLVEKGTFKRAQPLFWLAPSSGHLATLRYGSYTLMGYRGYQLTFDRDKYNAILREMAELAGIDPSPRNLRSRVSNTTFSSPEFNRLRSEKVRLEAFQEAWIPTIKAGGFSRFTLYDLSTDPLQQNDISKQRPEVTERLKKRLLVLYKDVMADAPDWSSPQGNRPN